MSNRQLLNVLPNLAGVGAGLVFPLVFNVVYYRLLGTEGYGLIGFYAGLAIVASLVDFRLSQTTLREVARRTAIWHQAAELKSLVLTFALISCGPGLLFALLASSSSQWLATSWLGLSRISIEEAATAISMMGGILALSFPANIFNAVLRGMQQQVLGNAIVILAGACRGIGTIGALYAFGATPLNFFSVQLLLSALELSVLGGVAWKLLPPSGTRPRFDLRLFQASWQLTATVWLSDLIGQVIMLSDKAVMSALLPLDLFGLYSLAFTLASTVQRLPVPFSNAYLPHFVELVEKGSHDLLSDAYSSATQLASAVVISAGLLMVMYARPIMLLLTGDATNSERIGPVFAMLVAANMLGSLMVLPKMLQFACGAAWIALRINLFQAIPYIALLLLLAPRFGMYAPAGLWLVASLVNIPIITIMTHQVALQGQAWLWFRRAILLPGFAAAVVLGLGFALAPGPSPIMLLPWLAGNWVLAFAAALLGAFGTSLFRLGAASSK